MVDVLPLGDGSAPLSGTKAIEDVAIAFVLNLERESTCHYRPRFEAEIAAYRRGEA